MRVKVCVRGTRVGHRQEPDAHNGRKKVGREGLVRYAGGCCWVGIESGLEGENASAVVGDDDLDLVVALDVECDLDVWPALHGHDARVGARSRSLSLARSSGVAHAHERIHVAIAVPPPSRVLRLAGAQPWTDEVGDGRRKRKMRVRRQWMPRLRRRRRDGRSPRCDR